MPIGNNAQMRGGDGNWQVKIPKTDKASFSVGAIGCVRAVQGDYNSQHQTF